MSNPDANCMDDYDPDSVSMQRARELILRQIEPIIETQILPLHASFGRILAEDANAAIDVPGFRNSAMDGYACRYADAVEGTSLKIAGTSLAGHPYGGKISQNHCIKIMTGAALPEDLDTVIMQEHTEQHGNHITITTLPEPGRNVRAIGSNFRAQSPLLKRYSRLGAIELGLLASTGCQNVRVLRKLKVACFSTGDELANSGDALDPGMIYDSNRLMLLSLLQDQAIEAIDLGIAKDNEAALRELMVQSATADMAISSGGVSVGDADFIKQALSGAGAINLWKIAMKPGRPLTHAILNSGTHFFGLPGNPVSGIVTFHQFVQPAIDAMMGNSARLHIELQARLVSTVHKQPGRIELQRGVLQQLNDGQWQVESTGMQDSHVLRSMHRANCYIVLDLESSGANENDCVTTLPFSNYWHPG